MIFNFLKYFSVSEIGHFYNSSVGLIKDVIEASASANVLKASAKVECGLDSLLTEGELVKVKAEADIAEAGVGISNTPFQAEVVVGKAGAEAGVGWNYTGVSAGASIAEAKAGPFGARLGLKFGAGVRNGCPEIDVGPVTCSIM